MQTQRKCIVGSSTGFSLCGFDFRKDQKKHRLKSVPPKPASGPFAYSQMQPNAERTNNVWTWCWSLDPGVMEDNGVVLFLSLGLRRVRFGLVKGRVDYARKRKKVVLKCGNVRCKRHVNVQDFSCITQ